MTEIDQLVSVLKQLLKQQGLTYRDVARALQLSEPSIKRLFASGHFSVEKLIQISNLLGYTLAELTKEAEAAQHRLSTLTEKQEKEIVSDNKLLVIAVCVINHWSLQEIVAFYTLSEAECIKYLLQLDRLRIIDLLPGNRIRLNVTRDFHWLPNGPIRQYFDRNGLNDFLRSQFAQDNEMFSFVHGMFTEQALASAQEELRKLRAKFAELHETSLAAPMAKRHGVGLLFALRGWEPEEFRRLKRS